MICSILGMHLFACKFCRKVEDEEATRCDRKNFDSFLWACVTVFQVSARWMYINAYTACYNLTCYLAFIPYWCFRDLRDWVFTSMLVWGYSIFDQF